MSSQLRHLSQAAPATALLVFLFAAPHRAAADVSVPFTESFSSGDSGWLSQVSSTPTWSATGGVDDDGFISMEQTISTGGFGSIIFRANNTNDASNDALVGDWLGAYVTQFSAYVRHDAPEPVGMYLRFDRGSGAGASTQSFQVPGGNVWTQLTVPITDSTAVFQSYGAAGPTGFDFIFSDIQNVQVALSSDQSVGVSGGTFSFGLDSVSVVPEPSSFAFGLACTGFTFLCRKKRNLAEQPCTCRSC